MTDEEALRLARYRRRVMAAIGRWLAIDSHHKSYEGTIEVLMPSYFGGWAEDRKSDWEIHLHCYLLCNWRHEKFCGATLGEALDKAETAIRQSEDELDEQESES